MKKIIISLSAAIALAGCDSDSEVRTADSPSVNSPDVTPVAEVSRSADAPVRSTERPEPAVDAQAPVVASATEAPEELTTSVANNVEPEPVATQAPVAATPAASPVAVATPTPTPPSVVATPAATPAAQAQARVTPVSDSAGAKTLANMGIAPAGTGPQLVFSDPKEIDREAGDPLHVYGFNMGNGTLTATSSDGRQIELNVQSGTNEEKVIPASELNKLEAGTYSLSILTESGEASSLQSPLSIY